VRAYASELIDVETRDEVEGAYVGRLSQRAADLAFVIRSPDHLRWAEEFRLAWPDLRRAWELALRREDAEQTALASLSLVPLWLEGRVLAAIDLVEPSLSLAARDHPPHHGDLVFVCAQAMFNVGDYRRAGELLASIGTDVRPPHDPSFVGGTSFLRGVLCVSADGPEAAERELRRAIRELASVSGDGADWFNAFAHNTLGSLLTVLGKPQAAVDEFQSSRRLGDASGNAGAEMQALVFEAEHRLQAGERDVARDLLLSALDLIDLRPLYEANAYCYEVVAAYSRGGDDTTAAQLLGLAGALRDALGARVWALRESQTALVTSTVRADLGPASFDAAFAQGRALDSRAGPALCRAGLAHQPRIANGDR
jgi:hypothetical protein